MEEKFKPFLGTGWSFPPSFDQFTGTARMSSEEQDVVESIGILLSTTPGERVMLPEYGSNMERLLFEPINTSLIGLMESSIKDAITLHEPRVKLRKVVLTPDAEEGKIDISVDYTIVSTNTRYNNVFPYYLNEANNL